MSNFTHEQLKELETLYGLKRQETLTLAVRDGVVTLTDTVWWRVDEGPVRVYVKEHVKNIIDFPELYSIAEPRIKVTYLD